MKEIKAHDFPSVYKDLNIDLSKLGCVMLDVDPIYNNTDVDDEEYSRFYYVEPKYLYYAKNKDKFWINGWVAEETPHMTLLYGLMKEAEEYKDQIRELLKDWNCKSVQIEDIDSFDSPYEDEEYYCIVAKLKLTDNIIEGHNRMQLLPHIDTYSEYKPHVTICYIQKNDKLRDEIIKDLKETLVGRRLYITNINLGGNKNEKRTT